MGDGMKTEITCNRVLDAVNPCRSIGYGSKNITLNERPKEEREEKQYRMIRFLAV